MTASPNPEVVASARADARAAAARAGITCREVDDAAGVHAIEALFARVWQADPGMGPVRAGTMRAARHVGAQLTIAHPDDDPAEPVGATFAFHGADGHLHSHVTGVVADDTGSGVGLALKLHQRAWALEHGVSTVTWTFDPLVRRNAWFNLGRLGATLVQYLPSFYGPMGDGINAGDDTDRVLVAWELARPLPTQPGLPVPAATALAMTPAGPVHGDAGPAAGAVRVQVPADVEGLRRDDLDLALQWRIALRAALHDRLAAGWTVAGVTADGDYVLRRRSP